MEIPRVGILNAVEGKLDEIKSNLVPRRPLRSSLAIATALILAGAVAGTACDSEITPPPPVIETRELSSPPVITEVVQQPYEQKASSEQQQALVESLSQFVNDGYLQRGISIQWAEFDSEIARTSAFILAGNQPFFVMNHYERGVENGRLRSVAVLPYQNRGRSEINFDLIPGRPFLGSDFDPTSENIKTVLGAIYKLPPMEWEESTWEYVSPPLHDDILRGLGQDSNGRLFSIEAVANRKNELSDYFGVEGLGGLNFVVLWVNYQDLSS